MILILSVLWLWRFIVPVFDWFLSFLVPRSLPTFVKRWRKRASPSRQWSASCGPVSWALSSGIKRRSSSRSKPSNSWRYLWCFWKVQLSAILIKILLVILLTLFAAIQPTAEGLHLPGPVWAHPPAEDPGVLLRQYPLHEGLPEDCGASLQRCVFTS